MLFQLFGIGPGEVLLILIVILLLLGPKKLPELARALGKAKREYKKASEEDEEKELKG